MDDGGAEGPKSLWFYDLNTGELFPGDASELPPIAAPSGDLRDAPAGTPAGVLASVIRIEGQPEQTVAFLQQYTPEAQAIITAAREGSGDAPANYEQIMKGTLVAMPPSKPGERVNWVPMSSPEGYKITMAMEVIAAGRPYSAELPP
jgi:hypothetical protein